MDGSYLRFYVTQGHRLHHMLLWEWLLRTANKMGIRGGSAFHAMAGFGRHHMMHEDTFFELGGSLIVEVEFIVTPDEKAKLLELIAAEKIGSPTPTFPPTSVYSTPTAKTRRRKGAPQLRLCDRASGDGIPHLAACVDDDVYF